MDMCGEWVPVSVYGVQQPGYSAWGRWFCGLKKSNDGCGSECSRCLLEELHTRHGSHDVGQFRLGGTMASNVHVVVLNESCGVVKVLREHDDGVPEVDGRNDGR